MTNEQVQDGDALLTIEEPKISVLIFTYNHEPFIREALEGVMAQEMQYSYEVIACDDASQDKTPSILKEFASVYPHRFRLFLSGENVGIYVQALRIIREVKGEYIAILDGDDKWTCNYKLQTQIDFLEDHQEYAGSFHDAEIVNADHEASNIRGYFHDYKLYSQFNYYQSDFFPWDVLERNIIPTSSMVVRTRKFPEVKDVKPYRNVRYSLAWLLQLLIIRYEKFRYFNEPWSVYNNHGGSVTKKNPKPVFIKTNIYILKKLMNDEYYRNITHHLYYMLSIEYQNLFFADRMECKRTDLIKFMWRFFYYGQLYLFRRMKSLSRELKSR